MIQSMIARIDKLEQISGYQQQKMNNLIRFGYIEAQEDIDCENQKVRVRLSEEFKTGWLIFTPERAGSSSFWNPPEVGENVLIICPYGEILQGIVIKSVYSEPFPSPGNDKNIVREKFGDHIFLDYDKKNGAVSISCKNFVVNCEKAALKNSSGEIFNLISEALTEFADSKTDTMKGPNPLMPGSVKVPQVVTKINSFS